MQLFKSAKCYHCDFREHVDVMDGVYYNIYSDNSWKNGPCVLLNTPIKHTCHKEREYSKSHGNRQKVEDLPYKLTERLLTKAYICSQTVSDYWILAQDNDDVSCPIMNAKHGYKIPVAEYLGRVQEAERAILQINSFVYLMELNKELRMNEIVDTVISFPDYVKNLYR